MPLKIEYRELTEEERMSANYSIISSYTYDELLVGILLCELIFKRIFGKEYNGKELFKMWVDLQCR